MLFRSGPRVVVLTGQPGAGSTRLATWLGERATEMGVANVLFARHAGAVDDGLPGAIARWLRADGLDGEAAFRWVHSLADAAGPVLPEEVPALVERLAPAEPPRVRFRDERERARPLRTFVDALARRGPVVVVLDDAHLGPETDAVLHGLVGPSESDVSELSSNEEEDIDSLDPDDTSGVGRSRRRLLVVLTLPDGAEAPSGARVIRLAPLAASSVRALLEGGLGLGPTAAAHLEGRVAGNPGVAIETVRAAWRTGHLRAARGGAELVGDVPLVGGRGDRVRSVEGTTVGNALELAAILGEPVRIASWRAAARAAGLDGQERRPGGELPAQGTTVDLDAVVQFALAEGLLVAHTRGIDQGWSFAAGVREALEEQAKAGGRASRWHRAAATATVRVQSAERLARHLLGSGEPEAAIPWIRRAANAEIDSGDRRVADARVQLLEEALDAAGVPVVAAARAEVAWLKARVRRLLGDPNGALVAAERGLAIARNVGSVPDEVRCVSERAEALRMTGRPAEARAGLEQVEAAARASRDPALEIGRAHV